MHNRNLLKVFLIPFLAYVALAAPEQQVPTKLNLVVVEGEGAINNIRQRTSRETIVQVQDENHKPVAGAAVVFLLPNDGPGGAFAAASKSTTVVTDANGQAVMPRFQVNNTQGQFQIHVHASFQGQQADTVIAQTNITGAGAGGASSAAHAGIAAKTILIIAGVAAAGAAAAAVAVTRGGNNKTNNTVTIPTGTITAGGAATIGGPQ